MLHIVFIAFFLEWKPSIKSLVMKFLVRPDITIGKTQQIEGSQIIARLLMAATTKLGSVLMTLKIKGQVCHEGLKAIL
jgi:hypothetical protein